MKSKIIHVLAALALAAGALLGVSAAPAMASGSADVQCVYGNNQVVGVWVEVSGGTSGFANRWSDGYGGNYYSYYEIDNGKTYRLHVGCSGTTQRWGITIYSPWGTGYQDRICTPAYGCYAS